MIITVTGKIASGKSEVMKILGDKGFCLIDADNITHELYRSDKEVIGLIRTNFGHEVINSSGVVDRLKLREIVFLNPSKLDQLNKLIHPFVQRGIIDRIQKLEPECKNIAIEILYLLPEIEKLSDRVLMVDRPVGKVFYSLIKRGFSVDLANEVLDLMPEYNSSKIFKINNNNNNLLKSVESFLDFQS